MTPAFLVTIDVEDDNLWARPRTATTRNAAHLPRFQALCEAYGMRPTYLTAYSMVRALSFVEFGRDVIQRGAGEIGMHLHAWDTPPLVPLTRDDAACQPYLIEYPAPIMVQKIAVLTDLLGETFGIRMRSHRAGRWGFNEAYARALVDMGYCVDCSVTPHISWRSHRGKPRGAGGPDYRRFPSAPYFADLDDISRPGVSPLLEVPMTILRSRTVVPAGVREALEVVPAARKALHRIAPAVRWLRPNGRNREDLLRIVAEGLAAGRPHLEFMLHSSELMPGGSPNFPTARSIEVLYRDLEALFVAAAARCQPRTLAEYHTEVAASARAPFGDRRPTSGASVAAIGQ